MNYLVIYEKSATGWSVYVPDLPGVITSGKTRKEAQRLIRKAIEFHLEGLRDDHLPIPEPSASARLSLFVLAGNLFAPKIYPSDVLHHH